MRTRVKSGPARSPLRAEPTDEAKARIRRPLPPPSPTARPDDLSPRPLWHVYLLECADGTYYCGITTDLERRLAQHNGLRAGGARYTRTRRPVILRASLTCPDRSGACRVEHFVQSLPRRKKLAFFTDVGPSATTPSQDSSPMNDCAALPQDDEETLSAPAPTTAI